MILPFLALATIIAMPVASPCIADDSAMTIEGAVKEVNNRDRRTGRPYSYFIIDSSRAYCLFGEDVDERSSEPTRTIPLLPHGANSVSEFRPYVGRTVIITSKLSSSNGRGPQMSYTASAHAFSR